MTEADKILHNHLTDDEAKYVADKRFLYDSLINAVNEALAISRVSQQRELLKFWLKYSDDDLGMTEKQENDYIDKCIENFNCG